MHAPAPLRLDPDVARTADCRQPAWIATEAEQRLSRSAYLALRDVSCVSGEGCTLLLRGHLPSYYLKQVAQTLVADIEGVCEVVNQIVVATGIGPASSARREGPRG